LDASVATDTTTVPTITLLCIVGVNIETHD